MESNDKLHDSLVSEGQSIGIGGWISGLGLSDLISDDRGCGTSGGWGSDAPAEMSMLSDFGGMHADDGYRSPDERDLAVSRSPSGVGIKRSRSLFGSPESVDRARRVAPIAHTPPTTRKTTAPPSEERVRSSARVVARVSATDNGPPSPFTSSWEASQPPASSSSSAATPTSGRGRNSSSASARGSSSTAKQEQPPRTPARASSPPPRATPEKTDKGLRSFSLKVCQKVQQKNVTTYAEVADELVVEMAQDQGVSSKGGSIDDKNIRRRVYDALNVLLAIDVVDKDKKNVRWRGFPTSASGGANVGSLQRKVDEKRQILEAKRCEAALMGGHYVRLATLAGRNAHDSQDAAAAAQQGGGSRRISMPFVVLKANQEDQVECEKSDDKQEVVLACSSKFDVLEDKSVLERMSLCREDDVRSILQGYGPDLTDWIVNGVPKEGGAVKEKGRGMGDLGDE